MMLGMAVFDDPSEAVHAAFDAVAALETVEVGGHRPQLRAGLHVGRPRRVGGDYLGVDVNIAARVVDAARRLLGWEPRHRIRGKLPALVARRLARRRVPLISGAATTLL